MVSDIAVLVSQVRGDKNRDSPSSPVYSTSDSGGAGCLLQILHFDFPCYRTCSGSRDCGFRAGGIPVDPLPQSQERPGSPQVMVKGGKRLPPFLPLKV